jgi:hypothetical protein
MSSGTTVVISPLTTPILSCNGFTSGARQFVVHDAFEMIVCVAGSYLSSLTPMTMVMSSPFAVALMMTSQFVGDMAWSIYNIHDLSLRQSVTPDQVLGRVNVIGGEQADVDWKRDVHKLMLAFPNDPLSPPDMSSPRSPLEHHGRHEIHPGQRP